MLDDIFDLQDKVTQEVVTAIEPSLRHAETNRARAQPTENLEAYELYLRAQSHFHLLTDSDNREAIKLTTLALERDPDYATAAGLMAWLHIQRMVQGLEPVGEGSKTAVAAAERVLTSDRADGIAMAYAAHSISMLARDLPRAREAFKQALSENPNAATVHMLASVNLYLLDRPQEALEHASQAIALSPRDPLRYGAYLAKVCALFHMGRYEEAAEASRNALAIRSGFVMSHLILIASLGQLGKIDVAQVAVSDLQALRPEITASSAQAQVPIFTVSACAENWREGWLKAGLPQ